ncbi:MAG: TonB-dependent receptor [Pseudomonadota bacterium]
MSLINNFMQKIPRSSSSRNGFALSLLYLACSASYAQENSTDSFEEIVVTAKKRNQNLQEVDISMSVISAQTINALQLRSLPDAAALIENVSLFEDFPGAGIPTWFIRGVGLQDFNSNNTPTAGVYLDNSYQVATVMGGANLFDVEQIEVLKGPQGGLYGRNTSGGAVILNTKRADLNTSEGYVNAGVASWNRRTLDGAINIPVNEVAAVRLSGNVENSDDGWQKSLYTGKSHGALDRWDIRSWALYQPTDNLEVQWKIQGGADDSEIALGRSVGLYDRLTPGAFCAAVLAGMRDDNACINFAGANQLKFGSGVPERIADQARDGSEVFSDLINMQRNDYISSMLELTWQLAESDLTVITSYDKFNYGVDLDLDGSRGEYGHRLSTSDIEVIGQELRLSSSGPQKLQWLAGVVWSKEEFAEQRDFNLRDNGLVGLDQGFLSYDQFTDSAAVFADIEYAFNEQWRVNANLRYTWEEKEYRNGNLFATAYNAFLIKDGSEDYKLESPESGSVSLNWLPSDTVLAYAKVSKGFKSGGFYGGFPFDYAEIAPYKEETIVAWELGVKQSWPSVNLDANAAIFYYDYQDAQGFINSFNPITNSTIEQLSNQGDARHQGAEFQFDYDPFEKLHFELGLAWLDARFKNSGTTTLNMVDEEVVIRGLRPYAPRLSGNVLAQYSQNIISDALLTLTMAYNYRSEFTGNTTSLADRAINTLSGYGVLDASAMVGQEGKPWKINMWVKNLLDKAYRTRVKDDGVNSYVEFFGEPRSVGVTLSYTF